MIQRNLCLQAVLLDNRSWIANAADILGGSSEDFYFAYKNMVLGVDSSVGLRLVKEREDSLGIAVLV